MSRWTRRLTSIRLEDNNGLGLTLEPMEGDFTGGDETDNNRDKTRVLNRQAFDGYVEGDDMEQEMSCTIAMRNISLTHASAARVLDFIKKQGSFASAVSVDTGGIVWAFKLIVTLNDGTTSTTKSYPNVVGKINWSEGDPGHSFGLSFTNNGQPVDA